MSSNASEVVDSINILHAVRWVGGAWKNVVQGAHNACSITDIITAESELPTCSKFADKSWNDEFMAEIHPRSKNRCKS